MDCACIPLPKQLAEHIYDQLTVEQRVGQLVLIALPGHTLNATAKEFLDRTLPGGLILCPYSVDQQGEEAAARCVLRVRLVAVATRVRGRTRAHAIFLLWYMIWKVSSSLQ